MIFTRPYNLNGESIRFSLCVCVCHVCLSNYVSVFPVITVRYKLKFGGKAKDTNISILQKNHNDGFHNKNASEK